MAILNLSSVAVLWFGGRLVSEGSMPIGNLTAFLTYILQILMSVMMAVMMVILVPARRGQRGARQRRSSTPSPSIADPPTPVTPARGTGLVEFRTSPSDTRAASSRCCTTCRSRSGPARPARSSAGPAAARRRCSTSSRGSSTPPRGSVLVNGVDVRDRSPEELWAAIGLVPQAAFLFGGTVASNLRFGRPEATEAELWHALEIAQARDFVAAMPGQLDAPIDQGGTNVSGGQRQRLSIARALVKRPPAILFDDCFSALDAATDARLRAALKAGTRDAAVVIVAQRVSTIMRRRPDHRAGWRPRRRHGHPPGAAGGLRHLPGDRRCPSSARRRRHDRPAGGGVRAGRVRARPAAERSKDLRATVRRLLARLAPRAGPADAVLALRRDLGRVPGQRPEDPRQRDQRSVRRHRRQAASGRDHQGAGRSRRCGLTARASWPSMLSGMNVTPGVGVDVTQLGQVLGLAALVYLLGAAFNCGQGFILAGVTQRLMYGLRREVEEKLARLPLRYFDSHPHGDILSRVTNDIDNLTTTLQQGLSQLLTSG